MAKFTAVGTFAGHLPPNKITFSITDSEGNIFEGTEKIDLIGNKFLEHLEKSLEFKTIKDKMKLKIKIIIED